MKILMLILGLLWELLTLFIAGVPDDALRLQLFYYSLSHKARECYNSLPPDSIITWNQMAEFF